MDGTDPELTGVDAELFDPLLEFIGGAVGIGDRDDTLFVGREQR